MPQKSAISELQTEEAVVSSPLRRSTRITSGNGTVAGVTTRRASQLAEKDVPQPRATRSRRTSTQSVEEKSESKTTTRAKQASTLPEEDSQKGTATSARRGRKPSVTSDPPEETEKSKPIRSRRSSEASIDVIDEKKPKGNASIKTRRNSASVELALEEKGPARAVGRRRSSAAENITGEPELEVKAAKTPARATGRRRSSAAENITGEPELEVKGAKPPARATGRRKNSATESTTDEPELEVKAAKTPARATGRRRSSAAENITVEKASTPAKQTARGRNASATEEVIEEVKKLTTRGSRKSVSHEEEAKVEEVARPPTRRGRRPSTDDSTTNAASKTPGKPARRTTTNLESDIKNITQDTHEAEDIDDVFTEETSPINLKDISVNVTPLKKRKLLENIEAELDLSIINESCDDINSSKQEEVSKQIVQEDEFQDKPIENSSVEKEIITEKHNSEVTVKETSAISENINNSPSSQVSPNSKKRLSSGFENELSPRKYPRLMEKLSRSNTPRKELNPEVNLKITENLVKEEEQEVNINGRSRASFVSSGSDGSFKLHLSNVLFTESVQNSSQENIADVSNRSNESSGSNKENIDLNDHLNNKGDKGNSVEIPILDPVIVARVSNVFKPNQREYSFMEPMDVDSSAIGPNYLAMDKSGSLDESLSVFNKSDPKTDHETLQESSTIFKNEIIPQIITEQSGETSSNQQKSIEDYYKSSCTETEDGNDVLLIEETDETVDISMKPIPTKSEIATPTSLTNKESSDVVNNPVENAWTPKSSSPINIKRISVRTSVSPLPNYDNTDSKNDAEERLRVSKSGRSSKSKSPSPLSSSCNNKDSTDNAVSIVRRSKSKSKTPSPKNISNNYADEQAPNNTPLLEAKNVENYLLKSPLYNDNTILSRNIVTRSKSISPLPRKEVTSQAENVRESHSNSESGSVQNSNIVFDQSFEKPRGSEELLITIEKIALDPINSAQNVETSEESIKQIMEPKDLSEHEDSKQVSDSEQGTVYSKTEVSTTNNDSEFNNVIDTDNDETQLSTKQSESTHYDFDLPSDDDDLSCLKTRLSGTPMKTNKFNKSISSLTPEGKDKSIKRNSVDNMSDLNTGKVELVTENPTTRTTRYSKPSSNDVFENINLKEQHLDKNLGASCETLNGSNASEDNLEKLVNVEDNSEKFNEDIKTRTEEIQNLHKALENSKDDLTSCSNEIASAANESSVGNDDPKGFSFLQSSLNKIDISINHPENDPLPISKSDQGLGIFNLENATSNLTPEEPSSPERISSVITDEFNEDKSDDENTKLDDEVGGEDSNNQERNAILNDTCATVAELVDNKNEEEESTLLKDPGTEYKKVENVEIELAETTKGQISEPIKTKRSLDEFASAKLKEYLESKAKEIEESSSEEEADEEESEPEKEYNEFIDGMAEEGEEDTPSEDSNQIIDEGESVGFSDSEDDDLEDDYDKSDSFICDDETSELLSGEEYDLDDSDMKTSKKSRIIDPDTLEDEDIIKVPKKKKNKEKPKKSRIIKISDSSSEEESNVELVEAKVEDHSKIEERKDESSDGSVFVMDESKLMEDSADSRTDVTESNDVVIEDTGDNELIPQNISIGSLNDSLPQTHRRSSLSIQENIVIDSTNDPMISKRINTMVESFCSTIKRGEIVLNLSLEYEDSAEQSSIKASEKTESVHILSNVKICPDVSLQTQELQEENSSKQSENETQVSTSIDEVEDLRLELNRKNLKRRLSKSLNEIFEEGKKVKKRRKNKKNKRFSSDEQLHKKTSSKLKKEKSRSDRAEDLKTSSFGLMNQLVTDVQNRPRRVLKPTSSSFSDANSSWMTTKVSNLKPSTSPVSKQERMKVLPKLHPKDFKNQLLSDPKRVKRVETKTLLKKKRAFV